MSLRGSNSGKRIRPISAYIDPPNSQNPRYDDNDADPNTEYASSSYNQNQKAYQISGDESNANQDDAEDDNNDHTCYENNQYADGYDNDEEDGVEPNQNADDDNNND